MERIKPVKLAIMGFENGHCASILMSAKKEPLVELVACCFSPRERIIHENRFGEDVFKGIDCYYDEEEMLNAHPEIQGCVCGGSNEKHMKEFRLCAERGIHIVSMKVPTLDMNEYDEMLRLQKQYGIKVHIELEMRWKATIDRIKELIADGKLGKVTSFCAYNYSHFPMWWTHWMDIPEQSYGKRIPLYEGAKRFRGGALTDHPHIIDMARYILDSEFETVYAEVAPNMRDAAETEDMVYVIGKMKNGVIVSLDPSYANRELEQCRRYGNRINHYPRTVQVELEIHGTKGSIICDAYGANLVEELSGEEFDYTVQQKWYDIITGRYAFLTNFARNILYGDAYPEPVSLEEHKKSIQVINACYDSIYNGRVERL